MLPRGDTVATRVQAAAGGPRPLETKLMKYRDLFGAGDEIRTHDPNLGKVVLYP